MYISGHAHTVDLERVEGVPYMVTGPAGKAPYGASNDGGFYAWTMFGIDPTPIPNQARFQKKQDHKDKKKQNGFKQKSVQSYNQLQWKRLKT